jgi:hypothetical protein
MTAVWFWSRSKGAAIAALISGGAELAVSLLTEYPGGIKKVIQFSHAPGHWFRFAAMTATMPEFLAFKNEVDRKFFLAEGAMMTAVSQLTRFPEKAVRAERKYAAWCMPSLWKFGGLTPLSLIRLGIHKLGEDELSTRSASLSYYFLLALFPLFLFLVSLIGVFAGPGSQLQENIVLALGRLAPGSASELVRSVVHQTFKSSNGIKLAAGILGALWAASGGMSAVVVSLNKVYEVSETRPVWKQ